MTTPSPNAIIQRLAERWRDHRAGRAALAELDGLPPDTLAELARDAQIAPVGLREVVRQGQGADRLMERMLEAFGLDPEELRRHSPGFLRDVSVTCSTCAEKGRCRRELAAGTAARHAADFCPNEPSFAALA